jgi:hypothetical protein
LKASGRPVRPPMPNIGMNAQAQSIGGVKRIEPPHSEMSIEVMMITEGMEISTVVVWKKVETAGAHAGHVHVVGPDDERQETEHEHRVDHRLVAPQRLAGVDRDDFRDAGEGGQQQHVHLRVAEEPEQVLEEQRRAAAGKIGEALGLGEQPGGHEERRVATRSINCMMPAASSGGKASSSRKPVTSIAHTKNGMRIQVMPRARRLMMVVMKFTDPSSDEVINSTRPISHCVWPASHWLTTCPSANPASGE